uniref:Uncharacterized protein n=1 Tax=Arundo donax TaxID=35708 RepID=A0A0A9AWA8_ARUDO
MVTVAPGGCCYGYTRVRVQRYYTFPCTEGSVPLNIS